MLVDMNDDSKKFFLHDRSLSDSVFYFYVFLLLISAALSIVVTHRVFFMPSVVQIFGIQCLIALFVIGVYVFKGWRPTIGSWRFTLFCSAALVSLYFVSFWLADYTAGFFLSSDEKLWTNHFTVDQVLAMVVVSPIVEEIFFRDLFFRTQSFGIRSQAWLAILFSSFAFMVAHLSFYPGAFILGVISSLIFMFSRSIVPSILFHALSNASLLFIPSFFPSLGKLLMSFDLARFFYR